MSESIYIYIFYIIYIDVIQLCFVVDENRNETKNIFAFVVVLAVISAPCVFSFLSNHDYIFGHESRGKPSSRFVRSASGKRHTHDQH